MLSIVTQRLTHTHPLRSRGQAGGKRPRQSKSSFEFIAPLPYALVVLATFRIRS